MVWKPDEMMKCLFSQDMCVMDKRLVLDTKYADKGCPSFSIGYYIGVMSDNKECEDITEADLTRALNVS